MKKLITLAIITVLFQTVNAQTPNWLWGEAETAGACWMGGTGIFVGPSDSIYVDGRFNGTMTLGGVNVTSSASSSEVFSGKMGPNGAFKWLKAHPYSNGNDYCYGFGGDQQENTYTTGLTQGSNGFFIDKYDKNGTFKWNATIPSGISGYCNMMTDNLGNVYVSGNFGGTQNFGIAIITAAGSNDMFLAKYNSVGVCQWVVHAGSAGGNDGGRGVAVDPAGNVFVCGSYTGTTKFYNPVNVIVSTLPVTASNNLFIAKYSTSGTLLWTATSTNSGFVPPPPSYWSYNAIAVDSCSNVYVTGHYSGTAQFGTLPTITSAGSADIYVAKCHYDGNWEWVRSAGGTSDDEGEGIALDKYHDVYVTGYFVGTALFSGVSVTTSAGSAVFVAKYVNSTGALQWVQTPTGNASTSGSGISIDSHGFAYVIGAISTAGSATFGPSTFSGATACGQNVMIAKVDTLARLAIIPDPQGPYCAGQCYSLPITVIGTFNAGNVFTAQLSDATGSFAAGGTTIGTLISTVSGVINICIPALTPPGSYMIRVTSSNPNYCSETFCNLVTINSCVLPIELLYFNAALTSDNTVLTSWATATETNNKEFSVERSADGIIWKTIGTLPGAGTSSKTLYYSYTDENPLPGVSYYKLRQTDYDGSYTYSDIKSVNITPVNIDIFPNPTAGNLTATFNSQSDEPVNIVIMDITGKVVENTTLQAIVGVNTYSIQTPAASGMYILQIGSTESKHYAKFVKQ